MNNVWEGFIRGGFFLSRLMLGGLFKSPLAESLEKGITVLDVGCGPGFWTRVTFI
jgi:2-polyprenyl-3-methyl-5-hydroxy-6-metoxy-1,4-benzoquinol methylase